MHEMNDCSTKTKRIYLVFGCLFNFILFDQRSQVSCVTPHGHFRKSVLFNNILAIIFHHGQYFALGSGSFCRIEERHDPVFAIARMTAFVFSYSQ